MFKFVTNSGNNKIEKSNKIFEPSTVPSTLL